MATLGIISYGIYLWHIIWVHQLKRWFHDGTIGANIWVWFAIVITLTLATATLSYLWVERPAIRWSHRQWPGGRRPAACDRRARHRRPPEPGDGAGRRGGAVTATAARPRRPPRRSRARFGPRRREVRAALELFALCGIAVAQPTFDLLGKNTGIFATRGATSLDLILLSLFIVIAPPLVLYVVEVLVGLVLPRLRRYVHALLCGLAFGVFAEEILKRTTELAPVRLVHLGWIAGLLAGARVPPTRVDAGLAPVPGDRAGAVRGDVPLRVPGVGGGLRRRGEGEVGCRAEDPEAGRDGRVRRVPRDVADQRLGRDRRSSCSRTSRKLASASTWYRNDTTVAPYTERAVPAILTGRLPPTGTVVPSVDDYPQNMFTMLGGALPFNVHEAVTALCPRSLCSARAQRRDRHAAAQGPR